MKYEIYVFEQQKTASFYKQAIAEYEKRLGRYCKITCSFIKKQKEWDRLFLSEGAYVVIAGKESVSSEDFSEKIGRWESSTAGNLKFFIPGEQKGKNALDEKGKREFSRKVLNLSDFSMNTAMTAMLLYEQIYRGYRILHHHPYHK